MTAKKNVSIWELNKKTPEQIAQRNNKLRIAKFIEDKKGFVLSENQVNRFSGAYLSELAGASNEEIIQLHATKKAKEEYEELKG